MKKYLPFIATLILLNGCTLSMEDFSIPEEERGMDEVYTEDTGYGEVSYQFADSVVHLTENLQDQYLVRVGDEMDELADSVIYISGDIPKNYRPYIGQKIYAGYGYNFPNAFSGRVIAVENQGGIYRVTTTRVQKDAIFKHLSYKFDQTVATENTEYLDSLDDSILERLGYQRMADSTIVDWSYYDSIQASKGNEKAKARLRMRARTRAESKDETEEDKRFLCNWEFDSRDISKGLTFFNLQSFDSWIKIYKNQVVPTKFQTWDPYIKFKLNVTHYTRCHTEKDEARDYECNYTETWQDWDIGLDFGFQKQGALLDDSDDDTGQKITNFMDNYAYSLATGGQNKTRMEMLNMLNQQKPAESFKKLKKGKKFCPVDGFEINKHIPFGAWFAIDINASGGPIFEFAGALTINGKLTTAKHRSGQETYGDNIYEIDKDVEKSKSSLTFGGNASLKIGYSARVGVDFLFAGTAGVGIGANLEAAIEGNFKLDVFNHTFGEGGETKWCKPDGSVKIYCDFWCDFKFLVKPLGFSLWEKTIAEFPDPHMHIFYWSTKYEPKVSTFDVNVDPIEDGQLVAKAQVKFSDLDGLWSLAGHSYYPMVKIFLGPVKDENTKIAYMIPTKSYGDTSPMDPNDLSPARKVDGLWGTSFFDKTFAFYYLAEIDPEIKELHFVPALTAFKVGSDLDPEEWNDNVKNYLWSETQVDEDYPSEIGPSSITTEKSMQTVGMDNVDFSAEQAGDYINSNGNSLNKDYYSSGGSFNYLTNQTYSMFNFVTRLRIFNASRIESGTAKLYVAIYNKDKKLLAKRWVYIKDPKSGTYTYQFHFVTNWKPTVTPSLTWAEDEVLYYRVLPYWTDNVEGEKKYIDHNSRKYYEIKYRIETVEIDGKNTATWGTVMPEIDLK